MSNNGACCNEKSYSASAIAYAEGYTSTNDLVTATASASATSNVSSEDAYNIAYNLVLDI